VKPTWFDRAAALISPERAVKRMRARMALDLLQRSYDGAATNRRTQGWRRAAGDANVAVGVNLTKLRDAARDLVRNNPYAESALSTIVDHAVGWGIEPAEKNERFMAWAGSTDCDADGLHDFAGIQKLVTRTVAESGECIVRRRWRRLEDGLPLPFQVQVLEPDYIDTAKDVATLPNGGRIVQGVEFDPLGRRSAYWLFREHPGSSVLRGGALTGQSYRVPAADIAHVFKASRPGQVRGPSWFAPVLVRFNDFADYEDATLIKQKIAACLAVLVTDVDGSSAPLGTETAATDTTPPIDSLAPGMIQNIPPGRNVEIVTPPTVGDYKDFSQTSLRAIATGLGVSYEDLTGDYTNLPFSAARMSRIRHWARVDDWRWRMLIPMLMNPVWGWAAEAADFAGVPMPERTNWTPPPMPMVEPDKEGLAIARNIRAGIQTLPDALRERGYIPDVFLQEYKDSNDKLDALGIVLDCDPRKMTQAGQVQGTPIMPSAPAS
jgi:lambda family phage portal protein